MASLKPVSIDGVCLFPYLVKPSAGYKQGLAIALVYNHAPRLVKLGKLLRIHGSDVINEVVQLVLEKMLLARRKQCPLFDATDITGP